MMIFASGFRHLVRRARPESDWLGLLALVSAAVWLAVTLAADGLMGGPAIIANFPPLIWFLVGGIVLVRQSRSMN